MTLVGTEFLDVAYTELNDPRQLTPLTEVLSRFAPSELSRFIDWSKRSFFYEGVEYYSPYQDLYLRSWTIAVKLFNRLLRYEEPHCLEEMQRQIQQLSRSFNVAIDGIWGCAFKWNVDLTQPVASGLRDDVPTSNEAFHGINACSLFHPARPVYTAAAAYALMALLVLEVRLQQAEKRLREAMNSEEKDDHFYSALLKMVPAIQAAPSATLVFDIHNPFRYRIEGFELFVSERYDSNERTSHLSMLNIVASCKVSSALGLYHTKVKDLMGGFASILASILCDQEILNFVYDAGEIKHPTPVVKVRRRDPEFATSLHLNHQDTEEKTVDNLASDDIFFEMRASVFRKLGHTVDWSSVQLAQLPEDRFETTAMEWDGFDGDGVRPNSENWPFRRTIARFCCLRS